MDIFIQSKLEQDNLNQNILYKNFLDSMVNFHSQFARAKEILRLEK